MQNHQKTNNYESEFNTIRKEYEAKKIQHEVGQKVERESEIKSEGCFQHAKNNGREFILNGLKQKTKWTRLKPRKRFKSEIFLLSSLFRSSRFQIIFMDNTVLTTTRTTNTKWLLFSSLAYTNPTIEFELYSTIDWMDWFSWPKFSNIFKIFFRF